jgi:hypothetical protein
VLVLGERRDRKGASAAEFLLNEDAPAISAGFVVSARVLQLISAHWRRSTVLDPRIRCTPVVPREI